MKYFVFAMLVVCLIATLAIGANAVSIVYDFDGTSGLTPQNMANAGHTGPSQADLGWERFAMNGNGLTKSQDWSYGNGTNDGPTALKIYDTNGSTYQGATGNAYMLTRKDIGESADGNPANGVVLKYGGIVMARMRCWDVQGTDGGGGVYGVGFSSLDGNKSGVIGFGRTAAGTTTIRVNNADTSAKGMEATSQGWGDWVVVAMRWNADASLDAWWTNGTDWSGNSGDWHQFASGVANAGGAAINQSGARVSGLLAGGFAASAATANLSIDWMAMNNTVGMNPWEYNPFATPETPEPGSLLALGSGLIGLAGFAIRRRRA